MEEEKATFRVTMKVSTEITYEIEAYSDSDAIDMAYAQAMCEYEDVNFKSLREL